MGPAPAPMRSGSAPASIRFRSAPAAMPLRPAPPSIPSPSARRPPPQSWRARPRKATHATPRAARRGGRTSSPSRSPARSGQPSGRRSSEKRFRRCRAWSPARWPPPRAPWERHAGPDSTRAISSPAGRRWHRASPSSLPDRHLHTASLSVRPASSSRRPTDPKDWGGLAAWPAATPARQLARRRAPTPTRRRCRAGRAPDSDDWRSASAGFHWRRSCLASNSAGRGRGSRRKWCVPGRRSGR